MRNLLAFLAVAVLAVAGVGWYLDWFKFQSTPTTPGHRSITVDIDGEKISEDVKKGAERGAAKIQETLERRQADHTISTPTVGKETPPASSPPPGFPPPPETEEPAQDPSHVP